LNYSCHQPLIFQPLDDTFWEQFWSPDNVNTAQDVFSLIPASDIRQLREHSPNNLATLCYKAVERLMNACKHCPPSVQEQQKGSIIIELVPVSLYTFSD
jgi:hypothetical protein